MIMKLRYWAAMLALVVVSGCYPGGAEYTDDLDLVVTNFDDGFDFKAQNTYAMSDSVMKITGDVFNDPDGDGKPTFLSPTYSVPLVAQIRQNMSNFGWTEVNKNANPDMIMLVTSMSTTNIYYYYDWWWWSWWYPSWDPWWGWYYPGSYYPLYVTGYRSGSIMMQLVKHPGNQTVDNIPVHWTAIFNGLAEGSTADINTRIQKGVDQAFNQSSYLRQ